MATVAPLDYLIVPRELIGRLKPRDLVVFALLFTARHRSTDYVWQTKVDIGTATGYGRFAVEAALLQLQRVRLVGAAERLHDGDDGESYGASKHCPSGTIFYKIWSPAASLSGKPALLSNAPRWLIALPSRTLCASAKVAAFLLGGLEEAYKEKWRGIGMKTAAAALGGKSQSQYIRLLKKLSDVGAFRHIDQRGRHSTLLWLSYGGVGTARLRPKVGRRGDRAKRGNVAGCTSMCGDVARCTSSRKSVAACAS